ncbi:MULTISPECIES: hypothetical protein [unclassified Microcoleus]|uniref:hypothetical protein n=1 Tax=unclassified Microcoleus TaxID=2642155 RepID=UPI0025E21D53|nr:MULTISPECIES: hypothetical protein [unclassified Microcoleus]
MQFQELMPDVVHWLDIPRIDRLVSISHLKYNVIINSGIQVVDRIPIPQNWIPAGAQVEIAAKKAGGYYRPDPVPDATILAEAIGRDARRLKGKKCKCRRTVASLPN